MNNVHKRLHLSIEGTVQGMGFRPLIYRMATDLGLSGWVRNNSRGISIEAEGPPSLLETFLEKISNKKPLHSTIQQIESTPLDFFGYQGFEIIPSIQSRESGFILPDISICTQCLNELFDPSSRRYLYPFTTCTHCGPRFSIVEKTPFDRERTTMKNFKMCEKCQTEYKNPKNRRFHSQTNACSDCGPHLELWDQEGQFLLRKHAALLQAADAIRRGKIVAIKGIGGFQIVVDATNETAVQKLRSRKNRPEKPLALMAPDLDWVETFCFLADTEKKILTSLEAPIVLLRKQDIPVPPILAVSVAPKNPCLGVMLPYSPLHALLMKDVGRPIIATSGNLSNEPICVDENEAIKKLKDIADLFLVHNRPIARPVDDSVVRVVNDEKMVLRRARGYAPIPIQSKETLQPALSVGGHLKSTIALSSGKNIIMSQHIGDLNSPLTFESFRHTITDFKQLFKLKPSYVVCDSHPNYTSTRFAKELGLPIFAVQHHYAHILSCMAENQIEGPLLGISWDGTGFGLDGTIWGGEFLHINEKYFSRTAHFRNFPLPGADKAIQEPRRSAMGILFEMFGNELFKQTNLPIFKSFSKEELKILQTMLEKKLNSPFTSSVGRLFDAITAIIGLRFSTSFEGQAAMDLEFEAEKVHSQCGYGFKFSKPLNSILRAPTIIDWEPMVSEILRDFKSGISTGEISSKFHNSLAEIIVSVSKKIGEEKVVLSGGCFQNKFLTERTLARLKQEGFKTYWHRKIPPNDGGISLGQIMAINRQKRESPPPFPSI